MANRATKTPISKIDDFSFEVSGIIMLIKILVMDITQYQVLATCGHFKTTIITPLIKFEKKERKSIWEVYQVLWTNTDHNKLPPIFS
ncbi:hypothetical protein G9A89_008311 [Geosiphon pyriformis]|nr:hypothetical protein G9A89_008311 [Geosiphon pyriformis]